MQTNRGNPNASGEVAVSEMPAIISSARREIIADRSNPSKPMMAEAARQRRRQSHRHARHLLFPVFAEAFWKIEVSRHVDSGILELDALHFDLL